MKQKLKDFFSKKFSRDVASNLTATMVTALSGLLLNTIVGIHYGAAGLGIYNYCLAVYVILSIVSTLGIPNSIVRHVARCKTSGEEPVVVAFSGLYLITIVSILTTCCAELYFCSSWFSGSAEKRLALCSILLSLPLFSINKGYRAYLNGLREMRLHATSEACRWLLVLALTCVVVFLRLPLSVTTAAYLGAEALLLVAFLFHFRGIPKLRVSQVLAASREHLNFGLKTFIGSSLLIINNKLDILIVSSLMDDRSTGIYSFASEIAKRLLALCEVVQINFSPIVSQLTARDEIGKLQEHFKQIKRVMWKVTLSMLVAALVGYPLYIWLVMGSAEYLNSIPVFVIISCGAAYASLYFWAGTVLSMAGYPEDSLIRNSILLICTISLNLLFTRYLGLYGAAAATACAYAIRVVTLKYFIRRRLGIEL